MLSLKLFPICIQKGKLVINQIYLFFYLNSVRQVVLEDVYVWNFFLFCLFWKIEYFAKKIIKFFTMPSHLGFERQIPNVIVFTVMLILLSHTRRRSDTDVQNCCTCAHSQNRCETVSISILQNSHRAEPRANILNTCLRLAFQYWPKLFIFGTMLAYGM